MMGKRKLCPECGADITDNVTFLCAGEFLVIRTEASPDEIEPCGPLRVFKVICQSCGCEMSDEELVTVELKKDPADNNASYIEEKDADTIEEE